MPISSRKLIGIIGLIYLFTKKFRIKSSIVVYALTMYLTLIIECMVSGLFTGLQDLSFEVLLFVRIIVLCGCYFIYKHWNNLDLNTFLKYFIVIVILNDFIALVGFFIPSICQIITTLEPMGDYVAERYEGLRFIGLGSFRYFEGGVVNCLAIISTFYLYSIKQYSANKTLWILGITLIIGMFIARTTVAGLVGVIFLFSQNKETKIRIAKLICMGILLLPLFFIILNIVFQENPAMRFAFEMIYNVIDGKGFETESSNSLSYQYIFPLSLKTWLIGDGIWIYDNAYYMHTDVGYCRLIFLWGLMGSSTFFLFLLRIIKIATKYALANSKLFGYLCLITLIVINAKGFTDINYFFMPIMLLMLRDTQKIWNVKRKFY